MRPSGQASRRGHREVDRGKAGLQRSRRHRRQRLDGRQLKMIPCQGVQMIIYNGRHRRARCDRAGHGDRYGGPRSGRRRLTSKQLERRSLPADEASMAVSKRQKREARQSRKRSSRPFPRRGQIWSKRTNFMRASERHGVWSRFMHRTWWKSTSGESETSLKGVEQRPWRQAGKFVRVRWVDEQHKEKSRYVVKDFANTRDPTMFAAAQGGASKQQYVRVRRDVSVHSCLVPLSIVRADAKTGKIVEKFLL